MVTRVQTAPLLMTALDMHRADAHPIHSSHTATDSSQLYGLRPQG